MVMGQQQIDVWGFILKLGQWAARIPLAGLAIFATACGSYLGFYFLLRLTQWVYWHWLSKPW
jgi:hypothetical protein